MNTTMKMATGIALGVCMAVASLGPASASRGPDSRTSISRLAPHGSVHAPIGFQIFCMKSPQFCRGGGAHQVAMSDGLMRTLNRVNTRVNRRIRPQYDRGADTWSINVTRGDCEDYALTKRQALIGAGLPASALRMATARTWTGEGHAVLIVRTSAGDFVLDNRTSTIKAANRAGLRWVAMAGANPTRWHAV